MLEAAGSSLLLPEEVAEVEAPDDDDDALVVYPPPAAPTYAAPLLVARALPPADDAGVPRVTASARSVQTRGLSKIRVNGTDHAPYFFFVNTETARDGETVDARNQRRRRERHSSCFRGSCTCPFAMRMEIGRLARLMRWCLKFWPPIPKAT